MNRKHKNKNKANKTSNTSFQKQSPANESNVEQNVQEIVSEALGKTVVDDQETNLTDNIKVEIPKAPKRQRNNKKKEETENTEITILENKNQNKAQDNKTDGEETCLFTVIDKNEISLATPKEDETKIEQIIQPIFPVARKKKNKKCTQVSLLTEDDIKKSEDFDKLDPNMVDNTNKNYGLTSIDINQNQTCDKDNNQKKKKDKKNKKRIANERSNNFSEKKLSNDSETEIKLETSLVDDLIDDDITQKVNANINIVKNENDDIKLLQEQKLHKELSTASSDEVEWKVDKNKKKGKKDKKMYINVKQSQPTLVTCKKELMSTPISITNLEKSFEKMEPEIKEFSVVSKNEQEFVLNDVQILDLPEKKIDNTIICNQFDTNNNTVIRETAQCEKTPVQKVELKVPFLIPDTPLVRSNDQIMFTKIMPGVDSVGKKLTDTMNSKTEVNNDLQELKLSIEKSLAELTALEKEENITEPKPNLEEAISITSKTICNEIKNHEKITKVEIPVNLNKSLKCLTLEIDDENSIYQANDVINCIKQEKEKEKPISCESDKSKNDNLSTYEPHTSFLITEKNSTNCGEDNESVKESNQKNANESYFQKKRKEKKEKKRASALQGTNEKLQHEPKEKSKKKNKQNAGSCQNMQISEDHKAVSTDVTELCVKFNQFCDIDCQQKNIDSDASKSETEKQSISYDNLTEKCYEKKVVKEDAVATEMKEELVEYVYEKIEEFEDVLSPTLDDVNKSFEIIASEIIDGELSNNIEVTVNDSSTVKEGYPNNSELEKENSVSDKDYEKTDLVSHPKNLLGSPNLPASSSKTDYKKEKNKIPHEKQPKVKIKESFDTTEGQKPSKESLTAHKEKPISNYGTEMEPFNVADADEDYVYKYSFRKVFLPSDCHVCKKDLKEFRVPCSFCNLTFYCSPKHKDDDWKNHQGLCFAVSSVAHTKEFDFEGLKFIYSDARDIKGQNYRLLRMQAIVSCEKILQRKLLPCEQEALLYPRMCAEITCREWGQNNLKDCVGCGQIAYCKDKPEHLPKSHQRWCKSYHLYKKLVIYQQKTGKLDPKLPTRVVTDVDFRLPDKINELLATLYEEKIDIDDMHYAALTQMITAPLTTAYCYQLYHNHMNSTMANGVHKKPTFVVHLIGAELQFEADALNKWEIFFLHLRPDIKELNIVLIGPNLNPSNLPVGVLSKIKMCHYCRENKRRVKFSFYDKKHYHEFYNSDDFNLPDIICAFNPNIHRAFVCNQNDPWTSTLRVISKTRAPFCLTSYTPNELDKDLAKIKNCAQSELRVIKGPSLNPYSSIRPDRNFISDDEMPLIFKNYYYMILSGAL
ncbi:hypothetical protein EVAR_101798_1 [Eumeta japonica]|uniref:MYND-type domain-containing protein n=1 Tax=Eumeta variegata TaxID=151549 RepID=A0A4C1SMK2_EUMVA|nr:hypothetical protein EVAR_101798_1 [Eumeta japonica]